MNIVKNTYLATSTVLLLSLLSPSFTSAAPLVSVGDNVDIFFSGSSSMRWTSNVYSVEIDEEDDIIWTISPGFEINVGRGLSDADLSIITRYDIVRYQDLDQLDAELFHIKAVGSYSTSRLDLNGSLSFDESKTSIDDVSNIRDLIESETVGANLNAEYRVSPKFSFGAGVQYTEQEYVTYRDRFADRDTTKLPFDVFYELTPKVDLSLGYTYSQTDIDSTIFRNEYETSSHFYNVGARGNLLPKLTGFFKVGYRDRDSTRAGADNNGILGLDADFTWAVSPKLTASLGLSRDFGVDGEGASTENSSVDTSVSYSIDSKWSADANVGYTLREYGNGREDNQYSLGARISYVPNQHWRFGGGYNYSENDSSLAGGSNKNHSLDVSASLRY
ncbi:MAG: outer membrane beta-barrel protein [Opitutales bacterium]|nr:outer membrane beta-barrel protein [Opitutales bacterium]